MGKPIEPTAAIEALPRDVEVYQGQIAALREHYETKLKEQTEAHRKRAEHDLQIIRDLQERLLSEQDRVVQFQRKLLAVRDLFSLDE